MRGCMRDCLTRSFPLRTAEPVVLGRAGGALASLSASCPGRCEDPEDEA
jgi:hypothetical protein